MVFSFFFFNLDHLARWDINAMDGLAKYMKIWFQALLDVYDEMKEELATIGRSSTVSYAKNAVSILMPIEFS